MKKFKKKKITRPIIVSVRFYEDEYQNISQESQMLGISLSDLIRRKIFSKPIRSNYIALIHQLSEISRRLKEISQKDEAVDKAKLKCIMDKLGKLLINIPLFMRIK